jgi:TRAP-type uncharacterized transport system substrate-binding protein
MGVDLSTLLSDTTSPDRAFRIIVMNSVGSVQNLDYLLNLVGVDIALMQSDVLAMYQKDPQIGLLKQRMQMIASLHHEEIHLLARGGITDIRQLEGKRVNTGPVGSGTQVTVHNLFANLHINVQEDITPSNQAIGKLITGDIDAMFFVVGKPASLFTALNSQDIQNAVLQFVPIPAGVPGLEQYIVTDLTSQDYPHLITAGTTIPTLAVQSVMAVYAFGPNDKAARYRALQNFVDRFFDHAADLVKHKDQFSSSWCQADLAAEVPGWTRYDAAKRWLQEHNAKSVRLCAIAAPSVCPACPAANSGPSCRTMASKDLGIPADDFDQPTGKTILDHWIQSHPGTCYP